MTTAVLVYEGAAVAATLKEGGIEMNPRYQAEERGRLQVMTRAAARKGSNKLPLAGSQSGHSATNFSNLG